MIDFIDFSKFSNVYLLNVYKLSSKGTYSHRTVAFVLSLPKIIVNLRLKNKNNLVL